MKKHTTSHRIDNIQTTRDTLTGRGGLALFNRYLVQVGILGLLEEHFGFLRKSSKGLGIAPLFKQVLCFLFDGTSRHLTWFDQMKRDEGYAATIEEVPADMASSHTVKRFFKAFSWLAGGVFRKVLRRLFLWRLTIEQPLVLELTLDTMVMDNDEAEQRHGVSPTYKKVKGFQPLQMIWNHKIVDAVFRGGKKHSNYGSTVVNMVTELVEYIRRHYRPDVTIILRVDAGFFDEVNFEAFNDLEIGFIASGKMYEGVKQQARGAGASSWGRYDNGRQAWSFLEFGFRCKEWARFWRAVYTLPVYEGQQMLLEYARPENVILTNIGINPKVLRHLPEDQHAHWLSSKTLIGSHHARGADELPHRGLKDFGFEQLPFKRFCANNAFYYCMLIGFFLFETYKQDVLAGVVPVTSYATTVRRMAVDFAAKIVRTAGYIILKVPAAIMERMQLDTLWQRCQTPIPIQA